MTTMVVRPESKLGALSPGAMCAVSNTVGAAELGQTLLRIIA